MTEEPSKGGSRFEATPGVASRVVGDETVLVNLDAELYYSLDPVGSMVWNRLTAGRSISGVAAELVAEYGIELDTACADVEELVVDLLDAGLLSANQCAGMGPEAT